MTRRRLTILTGTDHHQFNRLVSWADEYARRHSEDEVTVQYGSGTAPKTANGIDFMSFDELAAVVKGSDVMITHAGPGTIMDARNAGHRPIVLARDPGLDEHVDNHQMLFADWAATRGLIRAVNNTAELEFELSKLGSEGTRNAEPGGSSAQEPVRRLRELISQFNDQRLPVAPDATTVLYIDGLARRSSTTPEGLKRLPGTVDLGEVAHVWEGGIRENQPCACGDRFLDCEFWTAVGDLAFGGWSKLDVERVLTLRGTVERRGQMLRAARRHPGAKSRRVLVEYSEFYQRVYDAARRVSEARVVLHSSEGSPTAVTLSHNRHIDLRILHVIDAPRATNGGWPCGKQTPASWLSRKVVISGLAYRGIPVTRINDEDLSCDAATTLQAAWRSLQLPGAVVVHGDVKIEPIPNHSMTAIQ